MHQIKQRNPDKVNIPHDMLRAYPKKLCELLVLRGINTLKSAQDFLNPALEHLHDPFLLSDMHSAVETIEAARKQGWRVTVYGDYDVDGVCASALLVMHLQSMGVQAQHYIPSRHNEGYGLNREAVQAIAERSELLITVDCGITSLEEVRLAKALGMSVIVTDHHQPPDELPDCPVVNPLLNNYPFPTLCGAGTAFKLVCALSGIESASRYLDLAALATVADLVPLTGENRVIVRLGLEQINTVPRVGVAALIQASNLAGRAISAGNIAFQLAPRLNAAGRLGDAARGLEMLVTDNAAIAGSLAQELDGENTLRKQEEEQIIAEAHKQLDDFDFIESRIIILWGENWNPGIIGLAASKLVERYHFPTVIFSRQNDTYVGSCRSIPGIDIHRALSSCSDLFLRFGGHKQAAGLTIPCQHLNEFIKRMNLYLRQHAAPNLYIPTDEYDVVLSLEQVTQEFVHKLNQLQPTGFGNPSPLFATMAKITAAAAVGKNGDHLRMTLEQGEHYCSGVMFGGGKLALQVKGTSSQILYSAKINTWQNHSNAECEIKVLVPPGLPEQAEAICERFPNIKHIYLTELFYNNYRCKELKNYDIINFSSLLERLSIGPQGNLIIIYSVQGINFLLEQLKNEGKQDLDVFVNEFPKDPRAFNALCVCPCGKMEASYKNIVLIDPPDKFTVDFGCDNPVQLLYTGGSDAWMTQADIPNVDQLREQYKYFVKNASALSRYSQLQDLLKQCAAESALSETNWLCGLLVLHDMNLIEYDKATHRIRPLPVHKNDPEQNPLFNRLRSCVNDIHLL